jgi:hypothetical protein
MVVDCFKKGTHLSEFAANLTVPQKELPRVVCAHSNWFVSKVAPHLTGYIRP